MMVRSMRRSRRLPLALLVCSALAAVTAAPASAQSDPGPPPEFGIGSQKNVAITMNDGAVLRADVFYPTDSSGQRAEGPFPVVVSQTPYGKWLADKSLPGTGLSGGFLTGYESYLVERGYIAAVVDVRGTGNSDGELQFFGERESADSVAVVDWASKLPNATGSVGMTGASYLGIIQMHAAGAMGPDSPLKAIFPIVTGNDPYREIATSGGLMNLESDVSLLGLYNVQLNAGLFTEALLDPTQIADPGIAQRLLEHLNGTANGFTLGLTGDFFTDGDKAYDEDWWQERAPANKLERIVENGVAVYLAGTLWDVFQTGPPLNYSGLQNAWAGRPVTAPMSPDQPVSGRYQLLEKDQYHSTFFQGEPDLRPIQLAWFDRWLKDERNGIDETGTPMHLVDQRGERFEASHYPLPEATPTPYYLGEGSSLDTERRGTGEDPIVFTGASLPCDRATNQWSLGFIELVFSAIGASDPCSEHDILPQMVGPGQLSYETGAFSEDTALAGPIAASIFASANTTDTEWVLKLSEVDPDGTATDLTQGALLGSKRPLDEQRTWRDAEGRPTMPWHPYTRAAREPVVPGEVTRYDIELRGTFATIPAGHRLRLTILTSQTPHLAPFARDLPNLLGGVYGVQRSVEAESFVNLPLAPADAIGAGTTGNAAGAGNAATVGGATGATLAPFERRARVKKKRCVRKRVPRRVKCVKRKHHRR